MSPTDVSTQRRALVRYAARLRKGSDRQIFPSRTHHALKQRRAGNIPTAMRVAGDEARISASRLATMHAEFRVRICVAGSHRITAVHPECAAGMQAQSAAALQDLS